MRIAKLERFGYVDLDHVLGITEPWIDHGVAWFSLILAFRDDHETRGWNDYELLTADEFQSTDKTDLTPILLERIEVKRQQILQQWQAQQALEAELIVDEAPSLDTIVQGLISTHWEQLKNLAWEMGQAWRRGHDVG